jgi:hypothetical protein
MLKSGHFVNPKLSLGAPCVPFLYENAAALDACEGGPFPMSLKSAGRVPLNLRRLSELLSPGGKIFDERPAVEDRGRPDA